jgi:hypothetical protein
LSIRTAAGLTVEFTHRERESGLPWSNIYMRRVLIAPNFIAQVVFLWALRPIAGCEARVVFSPWRETRGDRKPLNDKKHLSQSTWLNPFKLQEVENETYQTPYSGQPAR